MRDRKVLIGLGALIALAAVGVIGVMALADDGSSSNDADQVSGLAVFDALNDDSLGGTPIDPQLAQELMDDPEKFCEALKAGLPEPRDGKPPYWTTCVGVNVGSGN